MLSALMENGLEDTPLMAACTIMCCTEPVRMLLAHGADPALQTSTGIAALHLAATAGRADVCKMLLEVNGCEPDVRNCNGITPLARAVYKGHVRVVELLHQWGADLRFEHPNGETLLHVVAAIGQRPLLEYLVHNGLDVNAAAYNAVNPVSVAVKHGNTEAVRALEHGASTYIADKYGYNLLMVAVEAGQTSLVELLLNRVGMQSNQAVDVLATNADDGTALHVAASRDRAEAAVLLLQHGAAVNAPAVNGSTPVLVAAAYSGAELVQLLLDAGAELTVDTLHVAATNIEHPEALQLLLEHRGAGAMIDNVTKQCSCCGPRTAVMMCEQPAHLRLLLAAGADVHKTTSRGNTALHVAAVHKFAAPVLCLLIKAGVDLHAVNSASKTAAQVAADSGNILAAALLTRAARDA
jgi:ankyrin repeat protein